MIRLAVIVVVLFLGLPNLIIVASSFNATGSFGVPFNGLSFRWYEKLFTLSTFGSGLLRSVVLATIATAVTTVIGTAAAFAITRYRFVGRDLLNNLVMSPLIVPEIVMGLSFLIALSAVPSTPVWINLVVLHTIIVLPYIVRVLIGNLQRSDPNLEAAALLLGATPLKAVLLVTLPIIGKGIAGAMVLAFVISFHNFTATFFLVTNEATLPLAIYQYIRTESDPTVAALSTLLMIGVSVLVWMTHKLLGLDRLAK